MVIGFIVLPLLVAAGFVAGCEWAGRRLGHGEAARRRRVFRTGSAVIAWLLLTALAAATGVLGRWDATPPPFALLALAVVGLGVAVPFSPLGTMLTRGLPFAALVGFQVYRFPLEILMHRASRAGIMPVQMSYSGWNCDIASGITAGALGLWLAAGSPPRWIVLAWNTLGTLLLLNIATIAVVSTPTFAWFGQDRVNTFVTAFPYVWLPAVLVLAALMGHLLVWRKLFANRPGSAHPKKSGNQRDRVTDGPACAQRSPS